MQFVAAYWSASGPPGEAVAMRLRAGLPAAWRTIVDAPGAFVAVGVEPAWGGIAATLGSGPGVIIGQLFDRTATDLGGFAAASSRAWEGTNAAEIGQNLLSRAWGAYVVIVPNQADPATIEIIRDPLGAQECLTWLVDGVRLVSSGAAYPTEILPPSPAIDWAIVERQLVAPTRASEALAMIAVTAVEPGSLCRIVGHRIVQLPMWRPADHCWPRRRALLPTAAELEQMIDACVAAWASCYRAPVAELSGGLDSAIVASSLRRAGAKTSKWFTYFGVAPEADERDYARATAALLELPVTEAPRLEHGIVAADLAVLSTGFRPGMTGMDVHHDRDLAQRAAVCEADAIFTGQGGDAVFFQMPTAAVAADAAIHFAPVAFARAAIDAARWTRSTVWSAAALALAKPREPMRRAATFVNARPVDRHPWQSGCDEAPPAKQMQVFGLANSRVYFVDCQRSLGRDMVHPLLSQPLVELVLATPVGHLTGGDRDRRLAREAFRQRLPAMVIDRHGKGDLTSYYGRLVARSHRFLRDHLCEGRLAAAGLISPDRVAAMLDPGSLAATDEYTEILSAALIESWVRHRPPG